MTTDTWLLYVGTILVMMSTPGPSHLLMLSNSLSSGFPRSLATAAGDLSANVLQMLAAALGLAAVIAAASGALTIIKWAGVTYLALYGLSKILSAARTGSAAAGAARASLGTLFLQGFTTSAVNPKAVVFFAALFPQFLNAAGGLVTQLLILGGTYLLVDGLFLCVYGATAHAVAQRLGDVAQQRLNLVGGALMLLAAAALALRTLPGPVGGT